MEACMERIWEACSRFILLQVYLNEKLFLQTFASMIPLFILKVKSIELETAGHFFGGTFLFQNFSGIKSRQEEVTVITPHLLWLPCFPNKKR